MRPSKMTLGDASGDAAQTSHLANTQDNDVLQAIRDGDLETLVSLINSIVRLFKFILFLLKIFDEIFSCQTAS